MRRARPWSDFVWLNPPVSSVVRDHRLVVTTAPDTDFWRTTSYGFVHDNGHFFGTPVDGDYGAELDFEGVFGAQFDQAGLMIRASSEVWLKAGVERSDGQLFASVVVTNGQSDWAVSPLETGTGTTRVTVRVSRVADAITVRFGVGAHPALTLLRLTYLPTDRPFLVGPFGCSPVGPGLEITFDPVRIGDPDRSLHPG